MQADSGTVSHVHTHFRTATSGVQVERCTFIADVAGVLHNRNSVLSRAHCGVVVVGSCQLTHSPDLCCCNERPSLLTNSQRTCKLAHTQPVTHNKPPLCFKGRESVCVCVCSCRQQWDWIEVSQHKLIKSDCTQIQPSPRHRRNSGTCDCIATLSNSCSCSPPSGLRAPWLFLHSRTRPRSRLPRSSAPRSATTRSRTPPAPLLRLLLVCFSVGWVARVVSDLSTSTSPTLLLAMCVCAVCSRALV
jgi:hypothetical protein